MKIRVAIIGMGYIGESHIEAIRSIGICQLCAVADTNYELAKQKADMYGIEKVYTSVDELLADKDIDVVHNCTPNFLHKEINMKIIRSGKHLFSEKPLTMNYEEAKELIELKNQFPQVEAAVDFNYRLNPMVQEIKARIANGEAGDIRVITGSYQQDWLMYDTDYSWRLEPEVSGNSCALADIGSHWMDIIQHVTGHKITSVMGDVVTVIPVRKKPAKQQETIRDAVSADYVEVEVKNEDYAAVMFKTDKGATGVFHVTELAAGRGCNLNFEINGSKVSYAWDQEQNDRMWVGRRGGDNSLVVRNPNLISQSAKPYTALAMGHPEGWNDAFKGNFYAFYKFLADGAKGERIYSTLEDAAYIVKLTEKIIESSKQKTWINVEED